MRKKLLVLLMFLTLCGCNVDKSKETIQNELLRQFGAIYPNLNYEIEYYSGDKDVSTYLLYADNYYGILNVRDGGGDLSVYTLDTDVLIYIDHCEGIRK